jgi:hypothetical protein
MGSIEDALNSAKQVPKEVVVDDMAAIIKRMPFTDEEIKKLYDAIMYRIPSKQCVRCGESTPIVHSSVRDFMGTRSRICNGCEKALKEKEASVAR